MNKTNYLLFIGTILLCLFSNYISAQTNMTDGYIEDPSGTFYDSGGPHITGQPPSQGNYQDNEDYTFTICPGAANNYSGCLSINFSEFNIQNPNDRLSVFDGNDISGDLIGVYTGMLNDSGNIITSSQGCLTFVFESDGTGQLPGWTADWSYNPVPCTTSSSLGGPTDCFGGVVVCDDQNLNYNSSGAGIDELSSSNQGCLLQGEHQSAWFIFQTNPLTPNGSTLGFTITPNTETNDYDFAVYGPNVSCSGLGAPVRCSYAAPTAPPNATGLGNGAIDTSEGPNGNGFVAPLTVAANEVYILIIDNYTANNDGFALTWSGSAADFLNCNYCQISIPDPPTADDICQGETSNLSVTAVNANGEANFEYTWTITTTPAGTTAADFTLIGANTATPTITPNNMFITGFVTMHVVVNAPNNTSCSDEDDVTFIIQNAPPANGTDISANEVCSTDVVNVSYTTAPAGATITWDFGTDATPTTAIGQGPHEVYWSNTTGGPLAYPILVTVDDGVNCPSFGGDNITVQPVLANPIISACNSTTTNMTFAWAAIPGAEQYEISVYINGNLQPNTISQSGTTVLFPNALIPNIVAGDQVFIEITATSTGFCNSTTVTSSTCSLQNCSAPSNLAIDPPPSFCVNSTPLVLTGTPTGGTFSGGAYIASNGIFTPPNTPGNYPITYTYTSSGCDFPVNGQVVVNALPNATFTLSASSACTSNDISVTYTGGAPANATFNWDLGGGIGTPSSTAPFNVQWNTGGNKTISLTVTQNGCTSTAFSLPVTISTPLGSPTISCGAASTNSVTFNWTPVAGVTNYNLSISINGAPATTATTATPSYNVPNLASDTPVTITVTPVGTAPCGDGASQSFTCNSNPCPGTNISIATNPASPYCVGSGTIVALTGNPAGGTFTTPSAGLNGNNFNIDQAGVGTHTLTYTYTNPVTNCSGSTTTNIVVGQSPNGTIAANLDEVCTGSPITFIYTNTTGSPTAYSWDFDGGTPASSNTQGPHNVSWATAGTKDVTLTLTQGNCTAAPITETITVIAPLAVPNISCGTQTTNSVQFNWSPVAGASSYVVAGTVVSDTGAPITTITAQDLGNVSTYTQNGLQPGYQVTITITAISNTVCADATSTAVTCTAQDCPVVNVQINNLTANSVFCIDDNTSLNLQATPASGSFTISGTGLPEVPITQFTPSDYPAGNYTIEYTVVQGNCSYSTNVDLSISPLPDAGIQFNIPTSEICSGVPVQVSLDGQSTAGDTFTWNFGTGANPATATGAGPHSVAWANSGVAIITLQSESAAGCTQNAQATMNVSAALTAPTVTCDNVATTQNSVTFTWAAITDADDYSITGTVTDTDGNFVSNINLPSNGGSLTYAENGLQPGYSVEIVVVALSSTVCADASSTPTTCTAQDCPVINPQITGLAATYCNDATDIVLSGTPTGGTFSISGNGLPPATISTLEFDTYTPGTYTIVYTIVQGDCSYTSTPQNLVINALPTNGINVADNSLCADSPTTITTTGNVNLSYTYDWDFGADATPATGNGALPFNVSWSTGGQKTITLTVTTPQGCSFESTSPVTVTAPLSTPVVSCGTTTQNSVTFNWLPIADATGYTITVQVTDTDGNTVTTQQDLSVNGTTYTENGLQPGYTVSAEVTALSGNADCPDTVSSSTTCAAQDCPDVAVDITGFPTEFCSDAASITITATPTGGALSVINTDTNVETPLASTNFDPSTFTTGNYALQYTYTQGSCTYEATPQAFSVYSAPQPNFSLSVAETCINSDVTLTYTGTSSASATLAWDFGTDATPATANGAGPHIVQWSSNGSKQISVTVTDDGDCTATTSLPIEVTSPLAAPTVNCAAVDINSVSFSWNSIAEADLGYTITVSINGAAQTTTTTATTTYTASGLQAGDEVEITVTAQSSAACGNSPASEAVTCTAQDCPSDIGLTITNTTTVLCLTDNPVMLTANFTGGTFSGNGVVNNTFTPTVGEGVYEVTYAYTDITGCPYIATLEFTVLAQPIAAIVAPSITCVNTPITIAFDGDATGITDFIWNFSGGTANGTGASREVSWSTVGNKNITLSIVVGNCISEAVTATVFVGQATVDAPSLVQMEEDGNVLLDITPQTNSGSSTFTYAWTDPNNGLSCTNCEDPEATQSGNYGVIITDSNSCTAAAAINVSNLPPKQDALIPNAFTPNGDATNSIFRVVGSNVSGVDMKVYSRWGLLMYETQTSNLSEGWDGNYKGKPAPIETYVYAINVTFNDGSTRLFKGNVSLIR